MILINPPQNSVNESLILVNPPQNSVNESLILVNPPQNPVDESLILVNKAMNFTVLPPAPCPMPNAPCSMLYAPIPFFSISNLLAIASIISCSTGVVLLSSWAIL
ncbi:hypothetical protein [Nostoc sp. CHAB 5715]|uniref:hypothetical protein n=1 Tax=Nostoc sp. CHAB 5715 TaxID=2780400 RepID=UPI001E324542|nr:hypothetical protein [Nostoc sp. CHAB 5715]MCC5619879.1 hypothetical protein [Nostoc sp. CHAB 5715]